MGQDVQDVRKEYGESLSEQALGSLHLWYETSGNKATGNVLEKALKKIGREDIVQKCMYNVQTVTDEKEKQEAKKQLVEAADAVNQCGIVEGGEEEEEEDLGDATLKRKKKKDGLVGLASEEECAVETE